MNVSIITVCYNSAKDLEITIESIIRQQYRDFEYLVIDGGSKDNTLEILEAYRTKFQKLGIPFHYISEPDKGIYDAMNKGAKLAKGEWINYLNSGDYFYNNESLKNIFSSPIPNNIDVCYGDTMNIYSFGKSLHSKDKLRSQNKVMPFCHQSVFVRSDIVRTYKFNIKYRILADHDFFYRLSKDKKEYLEKPCIVSVFDAQYGLSSTHPIQMGLEMLDIYDINHKWYYPFALIKVYLRYGFVQPLKRILPQKIVNYIIKKRRT